MSVKEDPKVKPVENAENKEPQDNLTMGMESVNRVVKLPVVEATINAATNLYEKAKESHDMINQVLTTAETTMKSSVEKITPYTHPVTARLEGPMKKVDAILCNGLDYVETKVPCVKLPPSEMLENTKNYISETVQPAVDSARNVVDPAVQTAKNVIEPAMQTAVAAKEYGLQKVEQLVKGKRSDATPDGRPRRVRPALLPSSFVSLVSMYVSLEELMQQEHPDHSQLSITEEAKDDPQHTCKKHSKN